MCEQTQFVTFFQNQKWATPKFVNNFGNLPVGTKMQTKRTATFVVLIFEEA